MLATTLSLHVGTDSILVWYIAIVICFQCVSQVGEAADNARQDSGKKCAHRVELVPDRHGSRLFKLEEDTWCTYCTPIIMTLHSWATNTTLPMLSPAAGRRQRQYQQRRPSLFT